MSSWYAFLDHPADLGIEAHGLTAAEAFLQAARGLVAVMVDPATITPSVSKQVEVTAADREHLLVRWLSEILYLYDAEHFIAGDISIDKLRDDLLRATILGEIFAPPRAGVRTDVKAITYHQLSITSDSTGCTVRCFIDI
jgi:SHS2 domain-containing protein